MRQFLLYLAAVLTFSSGIIIAPIVITNQLAVYAIKTTEPKKSQVTLGDSHAYAFQVQNDHHVIAQKGLPIAATYHKLKALIHANQKYRESTFTIVIAPHNFTSFSREFLNGKDPVAKSRFQYLNQLFKDNFYLTPNNILNSLKNYRLALKGVELTDNIGRLSNYSRCAEKCTYNPHAHSDGTTLSWDEGLESFCDSIVQFSTENNIAVTFASPPISARYWSLQPENIQQAFKTLHKRLITEPSPIFYSCENFRDCDHLNQQGAELYFKQINGNNAIQ